MRSYFTQPTIITIFRKTRDLPCSSLYCPEKYRYIFLLCPGLKENYSTHKKRRGLLGHCHGTLWPKEELFGPYGNVTNPLENFGNLSREFPHSLEKDFILFLMFQALRISIDNGTGRV
jgi:hypothetical protein